MIGGQWRSSAFQSPSYANVGPYVIVWNKVISDDQITNLAANPSLLKDQTVLNPIQMHNWLYLAAGEPVSFDYPLQLKIHTYRRTGRFL